MTLITRVQPQDPEVTALIAELDAYQVPLYGIEFCQLDSPEELSEPHVVMLGAVVGSQVAGIGAVKLLPGYAELKRVFVRASHRGHGIARALVCELEQIAASEGCRTACCETGILQHEALRLYRSLGYREAAPFGSHQANGVSVFLEKNLNAPTGAA